MIDIIITTYNENEKYLTECLESILNQTYKEFKLILVCEPNEHNLTLLEKYKSGDNRIKLIINKSKQGFVKSLNIGLDNSNSKYIARMDSDDICEYDRLEKQMKFMEDNPEIDVLGGSMTLIDKNSKPYEQRIYKTIHKDIKKAFCFSNSIAHPTVMMKRSIFDKYNGYNEEFVFSEDLELWFRLLVNGCVFSNLKDNLIKYRTLDESEKRSSLHWKYNLKARLLYNYKIWNFFKATLSIFIFWGLSISPNKLISQLTNNRIAKYIKGKNIEYTNNWWSRIYR